MNRLEVEPGESFALQGHWWLPVTPELRSTGVLTWDPDTGGTLDLIGTLEPEPTTEQAATEGPLSAHFGRETHPVIHGETPKGFFTLIGAMNTLATLRFVGPFASTNSFKMASLLYGDAVIDDPEAACFTAIRFAMRNLTAWVQQGHFQRTIMSTPGHRNSALRVEIARLPDIPVTTADGTGVRLVHRIGEKRRDAEVQQVKQRWLAEVTPQVPASLTDLLDRAVDLQQLVSIGAGETAEMIDVAVEFDPPEHGAAPGLQYFAVWENRAAPEQAGRRSAFSFGLEDIGAPTLQGWMSIAPEYRSEISRVMATRHNRALSPHDRILAMCAALESFDTLRRRTPNRPRVDYLDRVRATIDWAGEALRRFVPGDLDEWAKTVRNVRNDLAHHRPAVRSDYSTASDRMDRQLFWLLALGFLRLAGAPTTFLDTNRGPGAEVPPSFMVVGDPPTAGRSDHDGDVAERS